MHMALYKWTACIKLSLFLSISPEPLRVRDPITVHVIEKSERHWRRSMAEQVL